MTCRRRTEALDLCYKISVDMATVIVITFVGRAPGGVQRTKSDRITSLWDAAEVPSVR